MKEPKMQGSPALSRRDFCRSALLTAAVISGAEALAKPAAAKKRPLFYKNFSGGHIGVKASQRHALEYAAQYGFDSISPNPYEFKDASDAEIRDWLATMKAKNIRYGTASLPVDFRRDQQRFQSSLAELPQQAALLKRLGVGRMATWIMPGNNELTYLQNFNLHKTRLRQAAVILKEHGIRLGLEFVGPRTSRAKFRFPFICTQRGMLELTDAIGTGNVGLLLDSWHWYTSHGTVEELLQLSNDQIVHVHVNDAPKGLETDKQRDNQRRLPATTGVIDLEGFINALVKIGYDGPIECEPFDNRLRAMEDSAAVKETIESLNRLWALIKT